jgi:hypothetical protein
MMVIEDYSGAMSVRTTVTSVNIEDLSANILAT